MSIQQNFPAISPSLCLNFTRSKTLDPRITFIRTSSATRVNGKGLIEVVPANTPRFDHSYDPVSGTVRSLGLLIEESRSNLLFHSEDLSTFWSQFLITSLTTNSIISPSGTLTADIVTFSNNQFSDVNHNTAFITNGTTYTLSVWARSVSGSSQFRFKYWNTSIGVYSDNIAVDETWKRYTYTFTATSTAGGSNIGFANSSDGTSKSVVFWGAQLEEGSFPTSYIPTTNSTATRTADNASIVGENFSSWYNQSEGTSLINYNIPIASGDQAVAEFNDNTSSNRMIFFHSVGSTARFLTFSSGSAVVTTLDRTSSRVSKWVGAYKAGDYGSSYNGSNTLTNTYSSTISNINRLRIGSSASGSLFNGTISQLTYYPRRLSNQILQNLTK
jgi:hypothetical protein